MSFYLQSLTFLTVFKNSYWYFVFIKSPSTNLPFITLSPVSIFLQSLDVQFYPWLPLSFSSFSSWKPFLTLNVLFFLQTYPPCHFSSIISFFFLSLLSDLFLSFFLSASFFLCTFSHYRCLSFLPSKLFFGAECYFQGLKLKSVSFISLILLLVNDSRPHQMGKVTKVDGLEEVNQTPF